MENLEKVQKIVPFLHTNYPEVKYYLNYSNPIELVVAAILSPRVRDEIVNAATPALFEKFKTAQDYAEADIEEIEKYVSKISLYHKKTVAIQEVCKILQEKHEGKVPNDLDALVALPGIGLKTAQAILANAYDNVTGVVADSHVIRVAQRLGLSKGKDGDKVSKDLEIFPREEWKKLPWRLKAHGRAICKPKPLCDQCDLSSICPKEGV